MKKKCLLLTLLLAFCFALPATAAENNHEHCFCGADLGTRHDAAVGTHKPTTFTAWTKTNSLPTNEGNYYLTGDVTLDTNGWEVNSSICLCLNGHTIKGKVQVTNTGALTITDCKSEGKLTKIKSEEIGVTVNGTFHLYNGTITNYRQRGVTVRSGGTFNMYGGSITSNGTYPHNGGGVLSISDGCFRMYGGTIRENKADYGGGVCVINGGTFEMYGGAIQNNTVTELGGGVYLEIGSFQVQGNVKITGNTKGEDANNVYLATGKTITVTGDLSDDSEIKVTSKTNDHGTRIYTGATNVSGISMDDGKTISKYGYLRTKNCTEGEHTPIEDETVCGVCEKSLYYSIKAKYFSELSAAVQSVEAGDTITLLQDVSLSGCEVTKDVTLDLNGHSLTSTKEESATLTIGRNEEEQRVARLTVENSVDTKGWLGRVVFKGGILAVDGNVMVQSFENKVANKHIIDFIAEGYAIFTKAGELVKANVDRLTEGGYTVGEHTCDFEEGGGVCACGRACPHKNLSGNYCYDCYTSLVAETEGTYYKTLQEAVEAVKADGTIDLLNHCTLKTELTINKSFTIYSQGNQTMSGNGNDCEIYGTITVNSGTLTLQKVGSVTTLNVKKGGYCAIDGTTAFGTLNVENGDKSLIALPNGYIFVDKNSGECKKIEEGVEKYENIKVARCVHTAPNEMGKCAQCGMSVEAKIGSTYYTSLSEAMNTAKSGETVTVLTNVRDATYESGESIKLDLVETIISDLTINAGQVCIEGNGRVKKLTVNNSNNALALLYGGIYEEISYGSGDRLGNLIPEGYGYYQKNNGNTKTWYNQNSTNIPTKNLFVAKLPIVSVAIEGEDSVDYDDRITLRASALYAEQPTEQDIRYEWYVNTDIFSVGTKCELDFSPQVQAIAPGTAKVKLTVTVDGYSRSVEKDITVNKMDADYDKLAVKEGLVYNGEAQDLLRKGVFTNADGCVVYYRLSGETNWTTNFSAIKATDAKTYTVEWYLKGTDFYADNGSTEEPNTVTVTIAPAEVIISGGGSVTKTYDGTTEIDAESLNSLGKSYDIRTSSGTRLKYSTDYTMTAAYDSPNAGAYVYYTATFTLTNPNYVFASSYNDANYQKVSDTEAIYRKEYGWINQAPFPENDQRGKIEIINDRKATYTLENISSYLPTLPNGQSWGEVKFGYVDCENGEGCSIPFYSATVENGTLIFNALRDHNAKTECKLGYLKIKVSTDNYEDGFVYVDVYAKNKPEAKVTVTILRDMIYGESLDEFDGYTVAVDKVSGAEVEGTFHWQKSTIVPTAGKFTAVWHFDPKDDDTYKKTDGSVTITVQKATPEIKVTPVTEAGKTLADVVVSVTHRGEEVEGTLRWQTDTESNLPADTVISANTTYYCTFIPADTANYESVSAETVLYAVSTPATRFNVTTSETVTGGSVSVPTDKVKEGSTVTITVTPEAGYVIDKVTVKTKWSVVEVTDNGDGSFSFTQPAGSVTVTPTFKKVDETPANPDNKDDNTENGNNNGNTGDNGNNGGSTGLPVIPVTPTNPTTPTEKREWKDNFSDVTSENWFYEAVKYVYESGLMNGRTETSFMPEATATREQFISVLWRMAGSPAATVTATFTNLLEGEYYIPAISWAVEKGIANGYDDGRFGVGDPITREQLATMLYRYEKSIGGGFVGAWAYQMKFTDVENVSEWAWEAICWCNMKKIVNGRDDGSLDPQGYANRAEMAKIFTAYQQLER